MNEQQLADATLGNWLFLGIVLALIVVYVVWAISEAVEDFDKRSGEQLLDLEIRDCEWSAVVRRRWEIQ